MMFEWDQNKAKSNLRKHSVSFEEASTALLDPLSKTAIDPDYRSENIVLLLLGCQRDEDY